MVTGSALNLNDNLNNQRRGSIIDNRADKNKQVFFEQFEKWILKDIKSLLKIEDENGNKLEPDRNVYSSNIHRPFVAAVILMCCAIDVLAAFRYGKLDKNVGNTFELFIKEYFKKDITKSKKSYDAKIIYTRLRNALLHGYSLAKDLFLSHESEEKHLEQKGGLIVIDVFMFYYDLERVYEKYKNELLSDKFINEFNKRWGYAPLVQYFPEERIKRV